MKSIQFTPGPWHTNQVGNHPFVSSQNGERIADCGPSDGNWIGWESEKQAVYNAKLISAAPELLAACKFALGQLEQSKPLNSIHASSLKADIEIMRSAIAKATQVDENATQL